MFCSWAIYKINDSNYQLSKLCSLLLYLLLSGLTDSSRWETPILNTEYWYYGKTLLLDIIKHYYWIHRQRVRAMQKIIPLMATITAHIQLFVIFDRIVIFSLLSVSQPVSNARAWQDEQETEKIKWSPRHVRLTRMKTHQSADLPRLPK